jgi:hypothetical protein
MPSSSECMQPAHAGHANSRRRVSMPPLPPLCPCRCHICKTPAPSLKSMEDHHTAKHPSLPWEPEKCTDAHAAHGGVTTVGVAVRGSTKK